MRHSFFRLSGSFPMPAVHRLADFQAHLPKTIEYFVTFTILAIFANEIKQKCIMAKPIAPTPPLTGQAAVDFFVEMEQQKKATTAERARVKAGAERIKKMLTFNF